MRPLLMSNFGFLLRFVVAWKIVHARAVISYKLVKFLSSTLKSPEGWLHKKRVSPSFRSDPTRSDPFPFSAPLDSLTHARLLKFLSALINFYFDRFEINIVCKFLVNTRPKTQARQLVCVICRHL